MCWFLDEYLEVGEGVAVDGGEPAVPQEDLLQVGQVLLEHASLEPFGSKSQVSRKSTNDMHFPGLGIRVFQSDPDPIDSIVKKEL